MSEIEWADPPAPRRGGRPNRDWTLVANELRANPGRWARIAEGTNQQAATRIKQGRIAAFMPAGAFEARSVQVSQEPRRYDVYARFVAQGGAA